MENFINDESSNDIFIIIVDFLSYLDILSFYLSNKIIKNKIDKVLQIDLKKIKDYAIFFKKIFILYPIFDSIFLDNEILFHKKRNYRTKKIIFKIIFKNDCFAFLSFKNVDSPYCIYWNNFISKYKDSILNYNCVKRADQIETFYYFCNISGRSGSYFQKYKSQKDKNYLFKIMIQWIKYISEKLPQKIEWNRWNSFGIHSPYKNSFNFLNFVSEYSFGLKGEHEIMKQYFLENSNYNQMINLNFFQENHYLSKEKYVELITQCFENRKNFFIF